MTVVNLAFREQQIAYDDCPSCITDSAVMVSKIQDAIFYKYALDGEIVGCVEMYMRAPDRCHIYMLCVHPECQNRGVGSRALNAIFGLHPEVRVWSLITWSDDERCRHLYEKMGFVAVDAWTHSPNLVLVRYRRVV